MRKQFPEGFLWGASTSAHQVEGHTCNDWTVWEKEHAEALAAGAETDVWKEWESRDTTKFPEMFDPKNYISGTAADHYRQYEKDFDLAVSLGHTAHRLSIEWSRIEPERGVFNEDEVAHYKQVISSLRTRGLEPFVTLWHWTLPLWLRDEGGMYAKHFPAYFERYAQKVAAALGEDVTFWITLNEPEVVAGHSYLKGYWPPQKRSYLKNRRAVRNLVSAHRRAYKAIKHVDPDSKICVAKHNVYFEAYKGRLVNRLLKWVADWWWNDWFLKKIVGYQDVITLNHYHRNLINYGFNKNENKKVSDMGWELYPASLAAIAREMYVKYKLPIYVTEHGLADADDSRRAWFITESLKHLHGAIADGVDVRGYLHWSLLDNFEWDKGFWPRFGLIEIDYETLERTVRPSAQVYAKICRENALE